MSHAEFDWASFLVKLLEKLAEDYEKIKEIHDTLKQSDALLKAVIPYFSTQKRPDIPHTGSVEYGILPYWANNIQQIPDWTEIPDFVIEIIKVLDTLHVIPKPTITDADYEQLKTAVANGTAIAPDGTLYGEGPYQQLNRRWLEAVVNALLTEFEYGKHPFGNDLDKPDCKPPAILPIAAATATFAVTGDWGTGAADAIAVRDAAMAGTPDYLIHLGDVYYTGTPKASDGKFFVGPDNEVNNLIDFWPKQMGEGRSFTMNSNHEMYPGGWGLFGDTLRSPTFAHQNGRSDFLLENAHWQIFGLDSAYCSPDFLYMYGALNAEQIEFVRKHRHPKKRSILMTDYTPFDVTGQHEEIYYKSGQVHDPETGNLLLRDVKKAFADDGGTEKLPDRLGTSDTSMTASSTPRFMAAKCAARATRRCRTCAPWVLTNPGTKPPFNAPKTGKR